MRCAVGGRKPGGDRLQDLRDRLQDWQEDTEASASECRPEVDERECDALNGGPERGELSRHAALAKLLIPVFEHVKDVVPAVVTRTRCRQEDFREDLCSLRPDFDELLDLADAVGDEAAEPPVLGHDLERVRCLAHVALKLPSDLREVLSRAAADSREHAAQLASAAQHGGHRLGHTVEHVAPVGNGPRVAHHHEDVFDAGVRGGTDRAEALGEGGQIVLGEGGDRVAHPGEQVVLDRLLEVAKLVLEAAYLLDEVAGVGGELGEGLLVFIRHAAGGLGCLRLGVQRLAEGDIRVSQGELGIPQRAGGLDGAHVRRLDLLFRRLDDVAVLDALLVGLGSLDPSVGGVLLSLLVALHRGTHPQIGLADVQRARLALGVLRLDLGEIFLGACDRDRRALGVELCVLEFVVDVAQLAGLVPVGIVEVFDGFALGLLGVGDTPVCVRNAFLGANDPFLRALDRLGGELRLVCQVSRGVLRRLGGSACSREGIRDTGHAHFEHGHRPGETADRCGEQCDRACRLGRRNGQWHEGQLR